MTLIQLCCYISQSVSQSVQFQSLSRQGSDYFTGQTSCIACLRQAGRSSGFRSRASRLLRSFSIFLAGSLAFSACKPRLLLSPAKCSTLAADCSCYFFGSFSLLQSVTGHDAPTLSQSSPDYNLGTGTLFWSCFGFGCSRKEVISVQASSVVKVESSRFKKIIRSDQIR